MKHTPRLSAWLLLIAPLALPAQSPQWDSLKPGAHAAGFRTIETFDRGRALKPTTDFAGRPSDAEIGTSMQLGVWYPAVRPRERPLNYLELALSVRSRETYSSATAADSASIRQEVGRTVGMAAADTTRVEARPTAILATPTASYRNATPARGPFPVAVIATGGAISGVTVLAEYLATHGWIVVATRGQTTASGALQPTAPVLAIEVGVNSIAFATATAHALPGADVRRMAIIGVNFDSFSALEFQARYMSASVVVTINGWETIEQRANALQASPWYDAARIRVPLLNVHWDQPGSTPANRSYLEGLRYADRRSIVISGLDHFGLIGNPLTYSFANPMQRIGYQYLIRAVHATLANALSGPEDPFLTRSPADVGFPASVVKESWYRAPLPAIPTRAEFFEILGDRRDLQAATRLFREARLRDSTAQLFSESDMNLAAFRFQRSGQPDDVVAIHRLTVEAYPKSHLARNTLGNVLLSRADTVGALREFEAAIRLLEENDSLPAAAKAEQARQWRVRIAQLRQNGNRATSLTARASQIRLD